MASLFDVFGRLLLEDGGRQFVADAKGAGAKAGDAAGQSMGQRVSSGLKGALGSGAKVAALGVAAAFGIAAAGAAELEDATARYRAETGATADEAARMGREINATAGRQRASLEAVTDVAIRVRKDLHATGDEAVNLTEKFVQFARVTRQDAAAAVSAYDDILDAWGLQAKDALRIQDLLLASNQRFGGSLTDNQTALAQLAPTLRAMGATVEDGIALLNLFASSGLDATIAVTALRKAVANLKPGQTLADLIATVSAVEDPLKRAQVAATIFGAKAGAALANALQPGITSLDAYKVSSDDAADATQKAADVIDSTIRGRIEKALSEGKAAIRAFGDEWGGLATVIATGLTIGKGLGLDDLLGKALGKLLKSALVRGAARKVGLFIAIEIAGGQFIGGKLADAVGGALSALPGSSAVKGGIGKLGKFMGSGLGKALGVAFAAVAVVEVVNTYNQVKAMLAEQTAQISKDIAHQIATGTDAQLAASEAAVEKGLNDLKGVWDFGLFTSDTRKQLEAQLAAIRAEAARRAAGLPPAVGQALAAGEGDVTAGATDMVSGVDGAVADAAAAAGVAARKTPLEIAAGLRDKRGTVDAAMAQLVEDMKNAMRPTAVAARLAGQLTSKELAAGMASSDPLVRAQAKATKQMILDQLAELEAAGSVGRKANQTLANGLKSKIPEVRRAAADGTAAINGAWDKIKGFSAGAAKGEEIAKGVGAGMKSDDGKAAVLGAVKSLATIVNRFLGFLVGNSSGTTVSVSYPRPKASAGGNYLQAGEPSYVGERGRELYVPDVPGWVIPHGMERALGGSTVQTTNIYNLTVQAPSSARDPIALVREMRRNVDMGTFPRVASVPG